MNRVFASAPIALAVLCSLAFAAPAAALEQKLTAADGAAEDILGDALAIDGDTLVVGAPQEDGGEGAVYVYARSGDGWAQTAKLIASDGATDDWLGDSVAIDGDTIVAGATFKNGERGAVYTFARSGPPVRNETAKLTVTDGAASDFLGESVAIDGDTIVAGGSGDNTGEGAVYSFARIGPFLRTQTAKLTASAGGIGDGLGNAVAIDGETIVAGASGDDIGTVDNDHGSAYTFARSGAATRTETAKLTASDGGGDDTFGRSVAIDGDAIVVGAAFDNIGTEFNIGSVYTFTAGGASVRTETAKLTASDGDENDFLGDSVAIDGDTIAAGASNANATHGSVYTFTRNGPAERSETGKLSAGDSAGGDALGRSVAIDGATVLAGAPLDDVGANTEQGSAVVFFAPTPVPALADTTPPETTLKGAKKVKRGKKASFRFASTEPGSSFRCRVDRKRYAPCASPLKFKTGKLKSGKRHSFEVFAVDAAGNADPTPANLTFKLAGRKRARR